MLTNNPINLVADGKLMEFDSLEDFYLNQTLKGLDASPMDMAALMEEVTAEEVTEIARGVELDAVYFLKGESPE